MLGRGWGEGCEREEERGGGGGGGGGRGRGPYDVLSQRGQLGLSVGSVFHLVT